MHLRAISGILMLSCALLAMGALPARGQVVTSPASRYYVDFAGGSDSADGRSPAAAWKHAPGDPAATGNAAAVKLGAGDTVLLKGGVVYRGSIAIPASGEAGALITYQGDGWGAEKAVIDGSAAVTGAWTRCASAAELRGNPNFVKVYWTPAPARYSFLAGTYEGSEFIYPAQEPTPTDPFNYDRTDQLRVLPSKDASVSQTDTSITDPRYFTQADPAFYDGAYALVWHQPNVTRVYKIAGYDPGTHTVYHEKVGGAGVYKNRDTFYAILNHPASLSGPGQYWHDEKKGRLYVWPLHGADPAKNEYGIAGGGTGIAAVNKHHLVIEGFVVQKFVFGIRAGEGTVSDVEIRNNEVRSLKSNDRYAIHAGGTNLKVIGNRVTDCQRAVGILAGGKDVLVKDNFVQRTSRQGIWFMGAEHCRITGNTVADIAGTHSNGISIYLYSKDCLVAGNKVLRTGSAFTYHGNGSGPPKAEGLTVYGNLFDGATNSWGREMNDVTIVNNTFLGPANVGGDPGKQVFVNNIVNAGGAGTVRSHNVYTALNWGQSPRYNWTLAEGEVDWSKKGRDEVFVDTTVGDYHPKPGSPALDAGKDPTSLLPVALFPDHDFTKDMDGNPMSRGGKWNIGAYGYGPAKR